MTMHIESRGETLQAAPEPSNQSALQMDYLPFFFRQIIKIASHMHYGALTFELPDGRTLTLKGKEEIDAKGVILVRRWRFARRAVFGGDIGFFESFADGDWDTPDLAALLYVFARNADHLQRVFAALPFVEWLNGLRRNSRKNTKAGSKRNIVAHYDLGNSFYEKWLDPSMTYSSARFSSLSDSLEAAQLNKYESLARMIDLQPGDRVLEIGSGWGGFAEYAAGKYGAHVTGVTLSPSQLAYARERIKRAGLEDKAEFRLQDYRDVTEKFDKVASIEMFEAVGKEYWPTYFEKLKDVLKPGGRAGLQIITIADRFFDRYSKSTDFIQRYARTLHEWSDRFLGSWDEIRTMGFDERFSKLWRFYLAYCEAGFRAGTTNVRQILVTPA